MKRSKCVNAETTMVLCCLKCNLSKSYLLIVVRFSLIHCCLLAVGGPNIVISFRGQESKVKVTRSDSSWGGAKPDAGGISFTKTFYC